MTQASLKMTFYVIAGTILASISWGAINHSVVTGDYVLAVIVMGMMFFIVGKFFVDRWRPAHGPEAFHPNRPWKLPYLTTRRGLWLRVGFSTSLGVCVFAVIASVLVLGTTAQYPFMVLLGLLLVLRIPHLYWSLRSRYEVIPPDVSATGVAPALRYRGGSELNGVAFWLVPVLLSSVGALLAILGVLILD